MAVKRTCYIMGPFLQHGFITACSLLSLDRHVTDQGCMSSSPCLGLDTCRRLVPVSSVEISSRCTLIITHIYDACITLASDPVTNSVMQTAHIRGLHGRWGHISSRCPHNMVKRLRSVRQFGAPQLISTGYACWQRYCTTLQ